MTKRMACIVLLFCAAAICANAQTFTTIANFVGPNGIDPFDPLAQGFDGNLYGTTGSGGLNCPTEGCGTVFSVTPTGTLTSLYSFCSQPNCADGRFPQAGLVLAADGNFYGTTFLGGIGASPGFGTVFKITPSGALTTLYDFCSQPNCADGAYPLTLAQAVDGNFYGATYGGGVGGYAPGYGTVFRITPAGKLTTLYAFCLQNGCADGDAPAAPLMQAADGDFYGTTQQGGVYGVGGTIYKLTPEGVLTTLHSFCAQSNCLDGAGPGDGALVQGADGSLYGATYQGGQWEDGTAYRITLGGKLTTLASFCSEQLTCASGAEPLFGLVQGSDGSFYGTNTAGGSDREGVVFKLTLPNKLTILHTFCDEPGCGGPAYGLAQATDGNLYGITGLGGTSGYGTVYSLSLGLAPFVETLPTSRAIGTQVIILGNGLTATTGITFNGVPATTFTVASDTQITVTVPSGATTGFVTVTTASGTLTSNKKFRVIH